MGCRCGNVVDIAPVIADKHGPLSVESNFDPTGIPNRMVATVVARPGGQTKKSLGKVSVFGRSQLYRLSVGGPEAHSDSTGRIEHRHRLFKKGAQRGERGQHGG